MSSSPSKTTPTASAVDAVSSTTHTSAKKPASTAPASKAALPVPPASVAPSPTPPAGYTPIPKGSVRKYRKLPQALVPTVPGVASELKDSTTYKEDFGTFAPDQTTLVNLLLAVVMLEAAVGPAQLYAGYVEDERTVIVDAALQLIGQLAKLLKLNLTQDSALAQRYPNLLAFLNARAQPGKEGKARVKASKKKAAASAAEPAAAPVTAPAAAAGSGH